MGIGAVLLWLRWCKAICSWTLGTTMTAEGGRRCTVRVFEALRDDAGLGLPHLPIPLVQVAETIGSAACRRSVIAWSEEGEPRAAR